KRPKVSSSIIPTAKVEAIRNLAAALIVSRNIPINIFEDSYLKSLLQHHDAALFSQVPWGRNDMRQRILRLYQQGKKSIQQQLSQSISKIHICFDLWTSPNNKALIAITSHF
ncbi:hypothetical protein LZ30DRAFT_554737, partial [Colletotrichum cereale]